MSDDPFERGRQSASNQVRQIEAARVRNSELRQELQKHFSDGEYEFYPHSVAPMITYRDPIGRTAEFSAHATPEGPFLVYSTFHSKTSCTLVSEVVELAGEFFERTHNKRL